MRIAKSSSLCVLLFLCVCAIAQNEKQPLLKILQELEQRFQVSFTYLDENIEHVSVVPPSEYLSLEQSLKVIEKQTALIFKQISPRFITISRRERLSFDVCGILIDTSDSTKLAGALISSGNRFTTSSSEGYFRLSKLPGNSPLTIQTLGYEAKTIVVTGDSCQLISLTPIPVVLEEVVVSSYLTEGIDKKTDGSFVINTKSLGILPGLVEPDVLQTMQVLPGIQSADETISNLNVRGGTHDQNLILWDGIRMYQTGHFFGLISAFNPYLTKEVSLTKNGTTAALDEGVSSTIRIQSDDSLVSNVKGGAGLNLVNGDLFLKIPVSKKSSLHISSRRSLADIFATPTYRKYYSRAFKGTDATYSSDSVTNTNEKFLFYDVSTRLIINPTSRDQFRLNLLYTDNSLQYQETSILKNMAGARTSWLTQSSTAGGAYYKKLWSENFTTSSQVYVSSYSLAAVNHNIPYDQRIRQLNEVLDWGVRVDNGVVISRRADLLSGYQFQEVGILNLEDVNNPNFFSAVKNVLRTHSVFAELNADAGQKHNSTALRFGLRANYYPKFAKVIPEVRLAINQKFLEKFSVEILGEMKSQSATQVIDYQTDFLGIEKRRWVLADQQNIPIVRSRQLSVGIHYVQPRFLVSLEGYVKSVNGITSSSQGFQNQFQYIHATGGYNTKGVDFIINKRLRQFNCWAGYSYMENSSTFEGFIPPTFPGNLHILQTVKFGANYYYGRFQFSTGLNWHTGLPYTQPVDERPLVANSIDYKSPNSSRLKNYFRPDFSVKYNFPLSQRVQALAGLSLWNFVDRSNVIAAYYQVNNDRIEQFKKKALAFTPNAIFRISF